MKTIDFETSHHVSVEFEIAPSLLRLGASLLDMIFIVIYELLLSAIIGISLFKLGSSSLSTLLSFILFSIPFLFYSPVFEYFTNGKSLGKMICSIRVVKTTGENAGFKEYFTRWLFRVPDHWLTFGFLGMFMASSSKEGQRLGDMMAGTVVINSKNSKSISLNRLVNNLTNSLEVKYTNLTQFTDAEILSLKKMNERFSANPSKENKIAIDNAALHMAKLIGFETTPEKSNAFLAQIVNDYVIQTR